MKEFNEISLAHHKVNHLTNFKLQESRKGLLQVQEENEEIKIFLRESFLGPCSFPVALEWEFSR